MGLSITRKVGEQVLIEHTDGSQIVLTVTKQGHGQVAMNFQADRETYRIARTELLAENSIAVLPSKPR